MNRIATRVYLAFPRETDKTPRPAHGRAIDVSQREKIARPKTAAPRRTADWS